MTSTHYTLNVDGVDRVASPEQAMEDLDRLGSDLFKSEELTFEPTVHWIDYMDLILKALLVIAVVLLGVRL